MKKLLALVLAVVMMLGIASVALAETTDTAAAPSSLEVIQTAGVLKVGVDAAFAPMTYKDADGNYAGFDIDLATAVAEKLGVTVEFVEVDWANLEAALSDGTIDCVWSGMSINDEREAAMTVSDAYLESNTVIMVHKDTASTMEELVGKSVAVQAGSFAEQILCEDYVDLSAQMTIIGVADSDAALTALLNTDEEQTTVDAVMLDSIYAAYQITTNEALADYVLIGDLYADLFGIGFEKGDYLLCGTVEEILYGMAQDGSLAEISTKWFGEDVTLIGK